MTTDIEPKHQLAMLNQASPRNLLDIIHDSTGARIWFPLGSSTNRVMDILQQQQSFNNLLPIFPRRNGFYAPRLCPTPNPINSPFLSLFQRPEARTMVTIYGNVNACVMARKTLMVNLWFYKNHNFEINEFHTTAVIWTIIETLWYKPSKIRSSALLVYLAWVHTVHGSSCSF